MAAVRKILLNRGVGHVAAVSLGQRKDRHLAVEDEVASVPQFVVIEIEPAGLPAFALGDEDSG